MRNLILAFAVLFSFNSYSKFNFGGPKSDFSLNTLEGNSIEFTLGDIIYFGEWEQLFLQDYLGDIGEGGGTKEGEFSRELSRLLDLPGTSPDGVVSHYLSRKILKENKNRIPLSSIVSINFEVSSGVYKTIEVSEVKSFFLAIEISDEHYIGPLFNQLHGVVLGIRSCFQQDKLKESLFVFIRASFLPFFSFSLTKDNAD